MEKKHIITIAGKPGSGKSSTAKGVAKKLEYTHFSSGDLFRVVAAEHGCTVEELNLKAEINPEIDFEIDEKLRNLSHESKLVIDSRTAFHWIPSSFKVYLDLDFATAARRVFSMMKENPRVSQNGSSPEEVYNNTLIRYTSENKRYRKLYNLDVTDMLHYNLVIDTSKHSLAEVIQIIVNAYREWSQY